MQLVMLLIHFKEQALSPKDFPQKTTLPLAVTKQLKFPFIDKCSPYRKHHYIYNCMCFFVQ